MVLRPTGVPAARRPGREVVLERELPTDLTGLRLAPCGDRSRLLERDFSDSIVGSGLIVVIVTVPEATEGEVAGALELDGVGEGGGDATAGAARATMAPGAPSDEESATPNVAVESVDIVAVTADNLCLG